MVVAVQVTSCQTSSLAGDAQQATAQVSFKMYRKNRTCSILQENDKKKDEKKYK